MKQTIKFFCYLLIAVYFTACEKDDPIPNPEPVKSAAGVYILNQGSWKLNNAGISYYDFETEQLRFDITNQTLGETGQDMIAYGSKLYVSVSGSSIIAIFDLNTGLLIKNINLLNGEQPREPRYLTSYGGKVYATTFDGNVVRIDTVSLSQDRITPVGPNPEGIAAVNGKLYVANSGGLNYPNYDNTLSIVDIATFKEERKLTVGLNPNIVHADSYGNVYLTYREDNFTTFGGLQKIDTKTHAVTNIPVLANQNFVITGDSLYFFGVTYNSDNSANNTIGIYNIKTGQLITDQLIKDDTTINIAYGIGVDERNKDVYISDADYSKPGKVYIFGTDGKKKKTLDVGVNACKFVFY